MNIPMKIDLIDNADRACLGNHITWARLIAQLRKAGEFQPGESVARLEITTSGITYKTLLEKHR